MVAFEEKLMRATSELFFSKYLIIAKQLFTALKRLLFSSFKLPIEPELSKTNRRSGLLF